MHPRETRLAGVHLGIIRKLDLAVAARRGGDGLHGSQAILGVPDVRLPTARAGRDQARGVRLAQVAVGVVEQRLVGRAGGRGHAVADRIVRIRPVECRDGVRRIGRVGRGVAVARDQLVAGVVARSGSLHIVQHSRHETERQNRRLQYYSSNEHRPRFS